METFIISVKDLQCMLTSAFCHGLGSNLGAWTPQLLPLSLGEELAAIFLLMCQSAAIAMNWRH